MKGGPKRTTKINRSIKVEFADDAEEIPSRHGSEFFLFFIVYALWFYFFPSLLSAKIHFFFFVISSLVKAFLFLFVLTYGAGRPGSPQKNIFSSCTYLYNTLSK